MTQPYATTADVEARWRALSVSEKSRAAVLISDASAEIRARFGMRGSEPPEDGDEMATAARTPVFDADDEEDAYGGDQVQKLRKVRKIRVREWLHVLLHTLA